MLEVLKFFSKNISNILKEALEDKPVETLEEIRLRSNGSIILKFTGKQIVLPQKITYQDILQSLQIMCDNSIYSYQRRTQSWYCRQYCNRKWQSY